VATDTSMSYVDHNILQADFRNADDHRYLQSIAAKYGIYFSRPGNGICHQVHLERFGAPGKTLLGSDSHTPTSGGLGMLAIGAGGLDVAIAMAGCPFYFKMPYVVRVWLTGELADWVSAKDVILELLRRLTVKGGVGKVIEYAGSGIATLSVPQRATITNMGAELGATSSIFPSDAITRAFLAAQSRADIWQPLEADTDAKYDQEINLDLSVLEPMIALPHSPDHVVPVREAVGRSIQQVCIGSCTNSSVVDLEKVAAMLKGHTVHPDVSLTISPGSKQTLEMIAQRGALASLVAAGARILECGCGPCIGMGQAPASGAASLRSFNRNFPGRSGTANAEIYLASAEVCAASALRGVITDPRDLGPVPLINLPDVFICDDNLIIPPLADGSHVQVMRGPNIQPLPVRGALEDPIAGIVLLVTGDNVSTDDIMPAGAQVLPLRSNIPAMSVFAFSRLDPTLPERAKAAGGGIIVGGENYGQGSSREHAALVPMYLGIKAVLAKSFARIHTANLINVGILPLTFMNPSEANGLQQGDELIILDIAESLRHNLPLNVVNENRSITFQAKCELSSRQVEIVLAGGLLNLAKLQTK
jgi:aconitate hydratase